MKVATNKYLREKVAISTVFYHPLQCLHEYIEHIQSTE